MYRAAAEERKVRIRVKVKHVLFTFHCSELRSSLMLLFHCVIYIFDPLTDVDVTEGKEQLHVCSLTGEGRTLTTTPAHLTFSGKATH